MAAATYAVSANLNFQNTVRAISSSIELSTNTEDYPARIDYDDASIASAVVYDPTGVYAFVALETSREVAIVDAYANARTVPNRRWQGSTRIGHIGWW